jgi:hypothetical protein
VGKIDINKETKMITLFNILRKLWRICVEIFKRLAKRLDSAVAKGILKLFLKGMSLWFKISEGFRRNIGNFTGRYQFTTTNNSFTVSVEFTGKGLRVKEESIIDADVSVIFKYGKTLKALINFYLTTEPDIMKLMLDNGVELKGNLNYMLRFSYMTNQLLQPLNRLLLGLNRLLLGLNRLLLGRNRLLLRLTGRLP